MGMRISDASFNRAIQRADANADLRISKHTGDVTSARHGFFSRLVRFFKGPTKQDVEDNKRIVRDFVANLTRQYGPDLAKQALLRARRGDVQSGKPLSVPQVLAARKFAQGKETQVSQTLLPFLPGGRGLALAADEAGAKLTDDRQNLVHVQLRSELRGRAATDGKMPGFSDIKAIAGRMAKDAAATSPEDVKRLLALQKAGVLEGSGILSLPPSQRAFAAARLEEELTVLRHQGDATDDDHVRKLATQVAKQASKLDPAEAATASRNIEQARKTALDLLAALRPGGDGATSTRLLGQLIDQGAALVPAYTKGAEIGTDDRRLPMSRAVIRAIAETSPQEARELFETMDKRGSPLRTMMAAVGHLEGRADSSDPGRTSAIGELSREQDDLLAKLGEQGGVAGLERRIDDVMRQVSNPQAPERNRTSEGTAVAQAVKEADRFIFDRSEIIHKETQQALKEELDESVKVHMQQFGAGSREFAAAAEKSGVGLSTLTEDHLELAQTRLEQALRSHGERVGHLPDTGEIRALVGDIVKEVAAMSDEDLGFIQPGRIG
jgi:hypothetical protein